MNHPIKTTLQIVRIILDLCLLLSQSVLCQGVLARWLEHSGVVEFELCTCRRTWQQEQCCSSQDLPSTVPRADCPTSWPGTGALPDLVHTPTPAQLSWTMGQHRQLTHQGPSCPCRKDGPQGRSPIVGLKWWCLISFFFFLILFGKSSMGNTVQQESNGERAYCRHCLYCHLNWV